MNNIFLILNICVKHKINSFLIIDVRFDKMNLLK